MKGNQKEQEILLQTIIEGIENVKGENITLLDLRHIDSAVTDYFVICTGNSNTQVAAIAGAVEKLVRNTTKDRPWHVEGTENALWVLIDYISIVVHVFQREVREYYDLESLWGDAKITKIEHTSRSK